ncbi:D-ribose pyranase [Erwinia sp. OLTSP20]|uniref:D-ribose pyranase n=1 Tax=unclassified Erwinia TaxID=2622719 RepID=UPI000C1A216E|nr:MULTISPECIES: D-ribose pyranase [unclassified Erwinia]PIJ48320.1 D-ribose pyranase [Erwinia sp. OAMSP11]PIJ72275.1 D-ribose pyranase [Erwinia sp. OLSSP12]PIJ80018.1 D-ribose pyranase [Erwinia sp. OLMTSP26]PIJ81634.1 D-ribose pyranase [Erwinia sp. OLCASP19]PIJ84209.1 D-ribose pyranase [Erwinia sp. OLMDSP33]
MKKGSLLQSDICALIARLGHTDTLLVADAGFPIPDGPQRIDLALTQGVPSFLQVIEQVTSEMQVERVTLAEEVCQHNALMHRQLMAAIDALQQRQGNTIAIDYVSHQNLKQLSRQSRGVVRSGECTPYSNILLHAGVTF